MSTSPRVSSVIGTISTTISAAGSSSGSSAMPRMPSRAVRPTRVTSHSKPSSRRRIACAMLPAPMTSTRRSASDEVICMSHSPRSWARTRSANRRWAPIIMPTASSDVAASCTPTALQSVIPSRRCGVMWSVPAVSDWMTLTLRHLVDRGDDLAGELVRRDVELHVGDRVGQPLGRVDHLDVDSGGNGVEHIGRERQVREHATTLAIRIEARRDARRTRTWLTRLRIRDCLVFHLT